MHRDAVLVDLRIDKTLIETTPEHPFFTAEAGWVAAGALWAGAHIRTAAGTAGVVQQIAVVARTQVMYNLTVATAHTFFVGDAGWLVHNACQIHHIATAKNSSSTARGGPWTPRFKALFDKAGVDMEDALNKVSVSEHYGPHPEAYHQEVFDRLISATSGLSGSAYRTAFMNELQQLGIECSTHGSYLNSLITK